jgi:hypothetical protein
MEQSFYLMDISYASATIAVYGCDGDDFRRGDAKGYAWRDGKWTIRKAPEPAH